jgi:predicted dehydrogenase
MTLCNTWSRSLSIKVGIIGFGLSARVFHLPFLKASDAFHVRAISSSQHQAVQESWPDVDLYSDPRALVADSDVDLVINTAPNHAHFPLSSYALQAGKHVVIEKPFVTRLEDGETLIRQAADTGRILSVYHNRRWDGDFLTVKKLLSDGTLGRIRYFETHFDRFRPHVRATWRESGGEGSGILFDLGPHLIDQAVQLFGMPNAVTAQVAAMRDGARSDDCFRITLHYEDMLAVLVSSPFCAGPNLRFKIDGEAGSYVKYGLDPQEARLRGGLAPSGHEWAAEAPEDYGTRFTASGSEPVPTVTGGYQQYFAALAACIEGRAPNPVPADEALRVMRLIALVRESAASAQTVIVK